KDSRIQSGAVLWLRHSFARAFSGDSVMLSVSETSLSVIASECNERGNQQAKNPHDSSFVHG
ncbi:MAG: hypothetical protein K2N69_01440, partial [Helicobacter sp.]|nr:hypothetical protein [Helicobacter sp.]